MENEQSAGYLEERTLHKEVQVTARESSIVWPLIAPDFLWGGGGEEVRRGEKRNGLGLEAEGSNLQADYPK